MNHVVCRDMFCLFALFWSSPGEVKKKKGTLEVSISKIFISNNYNLANYKHLQEFKLAMVSQSYPKKVKCKIISKM